jgi:hypothetical protein
MIGTFSTVSGDPDPLLFGTGMDPTFPFHGQREKNCKKQAFHTVPIWYRDTVAENIFKWWF